MSKRVVRTKARIEVENVACELWSGGKPRLSIPVIAFGVTSDNRLVGITEDDEGEDECERQQPEYEIRYVGKKQ